VSAGVRENGRPPRPSSAPDQPAGSFAAKTSTSSILGVSANNRGASAIRVRAISPARCAWRAASPANASNIANVAGPMRSAHQTGTAKRGTIGSSDVSVSRQFQNAELLGQKTAIALVDCISDPLIDVGVPHRAVIAGDRRNAAERIVRPMPVQQGSGQALTLRIVAATFRCTV